MQIRCWVTLVLLPAVLIATTGCSAWGGGPGSGEPWMSAYRETDSPRLVVERFQVRADDRAALREASAYGDRSAALTERGGNILQRNDLEISAETRGLAEAMRGPAVRHAVKRADQYRYELPEEGDTDLTLALPIGCARSRTLFVPVVRGDGRTVLGERQASRSRLGLAVAVRPDASLGISVRTSALYAHGSAEDTERDRHPLHDVDIRLRPGQSFAIRSNDSWGPSHPFFLRYEEAGRVYETVYLITYVAQGVQR